MTEERLEHALGGGIGLSNVNERLRTIYGAGCQLKLTSAPRPRAPAPAIEIPELRCASASRQTPMDLSAAVLVDDEQLARDELGYLLEQLGGVEVVGQAGNGVEALATIERLQPDVVFLDVQMPGLTGFEVARRLLDEGPASQHHLRDGVRSARDRGVRGQRGRLPAEAGRSGAARAGPAARPPANHARSARRRGRRDAIGEPAQRRSARADRPAGRRAAEPARTAGDQGRRAVSARAGRRDHLCVAGRREHHGRHEPARGHVELIGRSTSCRRGSTRASSGACIDRTS